MQYDSDEWWQLLDTRYYDADHELSSASSLPNKVSLESDVLRMPGHVLNII
jgi:hypothetical protein